MSREIDEEKGMLLEIMTGPLKGQLRRVQRDGATVGRATENTIRWGQVGYSVSTGDSFLKHLTFSMDRLNGVRDAGSSILMNG